MKKRFSVQVTRPYLSYYLQKDFNAHQLEMQLTGSYFYLSKDTSRVGPSVNPLGEAALGYSYRVKPNFSAGLRGQYQNEFFLVEKGFEKYQFYFPWVYGVGPMVKFGAEQDWTLTYLIVPDQNLGKGLKSKGNYNIKLLHQHKFFERNFEFGLNYVKKYGVSLGYLF